MSISALIRRMSDAGASPEAIAIAVEEIEAIQASLDARRTADRDRKREQRGRQKTANVTGHSEDSHETVTPLSDAKVPSEVSPHTPLPTNLQISPLNPPVVVEEKIGAVGSCLDKAFPAALSPYQRFFDAWNAMAAKHGLPRVEGAAGKRLKALKARIGEHGEEAVLKAIANVAKSPHWLGENGWLGNFDSLLRPDNFQRMIENTYCAKMAGAAKITDPKVLAANKRATADIYDKMGRTSEADDLRREAAQLEQRAAA